MNKIITPLVAFTLFTTGLNAQTLKNGLKAHYPFNNNLNDITTSGNHLAVNGSVSPYEFVSQNDSALTFNGVDRLTSTSVFDASSFTEMAISVWIKTSTITPSVDQLILQGANIGFSMGINPSTGKLFASFDGSTAGSHITTNAVTDGNWHNIVAQSNGSTTSVYVDGLFDGSVVESLFPASGGSDNKIFVGASTFNTRGFTGAINEIRIYNRILTANEIDTLFQKSLSVVDAPVNQSASFTIFPNPSTNGHFSLIADVLFNNSSIEIIDLTGRLVWQNVLHTNKETQINAGLKPGVYLISITSNGVVKATQKLVVQ